MYEYYSCFNYVPYYHKLRLEPPSVFLKPAFTRDWVLTFMYNDGLPCYSCEQFSIVEKHLWGPFIICLPSLTLVYLVCLVNFWQKYILTKLLIAWCSSIDVWFVLFLSPEIFQSHINYLLQLLFCSKFFLICEEDWTSVYPDCLVFSRDWATIIT